MNDEDRLREAEDTLREALRLEPSPSLLGRVRAEATLARPEQGGAWLVAAAAVLVVGAALAVSLGRPGPEASGAPPSTVERAEVEAGRGTDDVAAPPVSSPRRAASPPKGHRARLAASSPDIIVAAGQLEALARFAERAQSGREPPLHAFALVREAALSQPDPEPVRIEPLVIAPLAPPATHEPSPSVRGDS